MVTFREAVQQDLPSLLELYKQLNPGDENLSVSLANEIWSRIIKSDIRYFVAVNKNVIIASCYISIIPNLTHGGKSIGFIENVVTDKAYRRKGIGKKIMEMAKAYAIERKCYKVVLQSHNRRKEAHVFYKDIGFDGDAKKAFELRLD